MAKKTAVKKPAAKKKVAVKVEAPVVKEPESAATIALSDWDWDDVPVVDPVEQEPFDTVIVSRVPVCEEKTGHVIKMNHFNAAGQLVK